MSKSHNLGLSLNYGFLYLNQLINVRKVCPTDLSQRNGRLIRQGNSNEKVQVFNYVTKETFDSYLYQLVEGKQRFISQVMTGKSPVRSADDIDDATLSYAEIKMLATGDTNIKEKMDLDIQVSKLKLLKQNFLSEKYRLEDLILKKLPEKISYLTGQIKGYTADIETLSQHTPTEEEKFLPMKIGDVTHAEKAEAGQALLDECKAMTKPDVRCIGEYRGFKMNLSFDTFSREYKLALKGSLSHTATLGQNTLGNIIRIDNVLEGLQEQLQLTESLLDNTNNQLETAQQEVKNVFPQEDELQKKSERLTELNSLLSMDKKDPAVLDGDVVEEQEVLLRREASER